MMPNEMSCVFGVCSDCLYFFVRKVSNDEDEEGYDIRCLITDTEMEQELYTKKCSHFESKNNRSLLTTEQYQ
jgi:hypothetical protein